MKTFSARETVWLQELDGIELAGFWPRALAISIDGLISFIILSAVLSLGALTYITIQHHLGHATPGIQFDTDKASINLNSDEATKPHKHFNYHVSLPDDEARPNIPTSQKILAEAIKIFSDVVLPILYFGIFLWQGNGRTPGKRLMKIRVVSLVHTHISFWHAVERALGYGAAALEGGFGFIQFFIHPYRRCAQDRLAETIVVTERSYQQKFPNKRGIPAEAETAPV